jgi:predicted Rossmann-fold nucleotide-binding protein
MKLEISLKSLIATLVTSIVLLEMYRRFFEEKTDCDFLINLKGQSTSSVDYFANDGELFRQHQACSNDQSKAARRIKLVHDDDTVVNLEENSKGKVTIVAFAGSGSNACHLDWGIDARIGYEFEKLRYRVWQGGGKGGMEALRTGSDLFCYSVADLQLVVALLCEAETASNDRKVEIASFITENYPSCQPENSYSLHSAIFLSRLPVKPYIGFGAQRVELYSDFKRLETFIQSPDVWLILRGSEGVQAELSQVYSVLKYAYLSPDKKQQAIMYNGTNWVDRGYLTPHQYNNPLVVQAESAEEVVRKTNEFIHKKYCSKESSLQTCPATLYRQPKIAEIDSSEKQQKLKF